jgi:hypothetical protein
MTHAHTSCNGCDSSNFLNESTGRPAKRVSIITAKNSTCINPLTVSYQNLSQAMHYINTFKVKEFFSENEYEMLFLNISNIPKCPSRNV